MKRLVIICLTALSSYGYAQKTITSNTIINKSNTKIMETEAKKVVTEFLTAVQNGDNQKLAELLSPEIKWSQPGNNRVSGIKNSNMEVFQMVGKMFELSSNTLRLADIKSISVNGNKVACLLHWNAAQPAGGVLDVDNIDVYTVENGQITNADIYSADLAKENAFWGE